MGASGAKLFFDLSEEFILRGISVSFSRGSDEEFDTLFELKCDRDSRFMFAVANINDSLDVLADLNGLF